jgi:hypothetical protein
MKEGVTQAEVFDFKNKWCNENLIISDIIKNGISDYFIAPILDVGAGLGDIAYSSLHSKEVICIDVNKIDESLPLSENHQRIQVDFFDYLPSKKINTLLISHTLQFLDKDVELLQNKIDNISPEKIILVINKNDDILGELISWSDNNFANPNPEIEIPDFPKGYTIAKTVDFKAILSCTTFKELAIQISYLMVIDLDDNLETLLVDFLKSKRQRPEFDFNQQIKIFSKNGK